MNIGIDIRCLMDRRRTGVGEYTYELLNALFSIDKENKYYLFYNSYADVSEHIPEWGQENVRYVSTKCPNKFFNASIKLLHFPCLDKLVEKKAGCNLDYFFSPNFNFVLISSKTKFILTVHDLSFEFFPDCFSYKRRLWHSVIGPRKQCWMADLILTPSENTKRDVVSRYGVDKSKVKVIYPGLSCLFKKKELVSDQKLSEVKYKYKLLNPFILCLATIEPRKNIEGLVKAFSEFKKTCSSLFSTLELVIAGSKGWKRGRILELIENTNQVRYIGYVDNADKPALYRMSKILAYPSLYEGFGFPVLEAMAAGIPVITSNRSSLVEIADGSVCLVDPNNVDEISMAIESILKDENFRNRLSRNGLERSRKFDWEETAKNFLDLIQPAKVDYENRD